MQFYEEFNLIITNDFKVGKLDFDNKNFLVNDQIIENNRAIIIDIVYIHETICLSYISAPVLFSIGAFSTPGSL